MERSDFDYDIEDFTHKFKQYSFELQQKTRELEECEKRLEDLEQTSDDGNRRGSISSSTRIKELENENRELQRQLDSQNVPDESLEELEKNLKDAKDALLICEGDLKTNQDHQDKMTEYRDKSKKQESIDAANRGIKKLVEEVMPLKVKIKSAKAKVTRAQKMYDRKKTFSDKYRIVKTCINCDMPARLRHELTGLTYCGMECYHY